MDDSILLSIKKMLGLDADYDAFDTDVILNINTALMVLVQHGVGVPGFSITGESETWSQFLKGYKDFEAVKTCVYLRVRLIFDPPTSSYVTTALENQLRELEWRLYIQADGGEYEWIT